MASNGIASAWLRRLRAAAREWSNLYMPPEDIIPLERVQGSFYEWLLVEHADVVDEVFTLPIYTPLCTWRLVHHDILSGLNKRGWLIAPNKLDWPKEAREVRMVLMRQPTQDDETSYIELVGELIREAKMPRLRQMRDNAVKRLQELEEQTQEMEAWTRTGRRARKGRSRNAAGRA